jgi:hypothetical protein
MDGARQRDPACGTFHLDTVTNGRYCDIEFEGGVEWNPRRKDRQWSSSVSSV